MRLNEFGKTSDLMNHKKIMHPDKVSKCRGFSQGKCNEDENSCWFDHSKVDKENEAMDTDEEQNESVFCVAKEKPPPDQMASIMMMIKKLSVQVEELEKNSKK